MVRTDAQEFFETGKKFHEQGNLDDALLTIRKHWIILKIPMMRKRKLMYFLKLEIFMLNEKTTKMDRNIIKVL